MSAYKPMHGSIWCLACLRVGRVPLNGPARLRATECPQCGTVGRMRRVGRTVAAKLRELLADPVVRGAFARLADTRVRQPSLPYVNASRPRAR